PLETYQGAIEPDWCPGCGDFGVLRALELAAQRLQLPTKDIFLVSGIGCSSNLPGFFHAYGVHSLHGRAVAVASGAKLANHSLHVVITGGDGDGYGIGLNHFIHAMRRTLDLTYIVMNNQIYGMTRLTTSRVTMAPSRNPSRGTRRFPSTFSTKASSSPMRTLSPRSRKGHSSTIRCPWTKVYSKSWWRSSTEGLRVGRVRRGRI